MDGTVNINTGSNVAPLRNVTLLNALINRVQNRDFDLPGLACFFGPSGYGKTMAATWNAQETEQLWRGMYILKEFSFEDLIETASIDIPAETAKAYCKMLLATGYLRVLRKADPSKSRIARYRLIRNNGPKPPQIQRVKRVFDPNTSEVFMPESQA